MFPLEESSWDSGMYDKLLGLCLHLASTVLLIVLISKWLKTFSKEKLKAVEKYLEQPKEDVIKAAAVVGDNDLNELMTNSPESGNIASKMSGRENCSSEQLLRDEAIFVFGGWFEGAGIKSAVQLYEPRAKAWTMWPSGSDHPIGEIPRRAYSGCIFVENNNTVYVVGGYDGSQGVNTTLCYDFLTNNGWREVSCMLAKRYYVSVAYADGYIYALGGHNGEKRHGSCERYCIQDNTWRPIMWMNSSRSDASAAAVQNKVYICGGFDGRVYHASCECYDPATDVWTVLPNMSSPRRGLAVIGYENCLYAVGGSNGSACLNTLERYNVLTGKWKRCGEMLQRKSNFSLAIMQRRLYIIGGWSDEPDNGIMQSVEAFDLLTNTCWASEPMCSPASATCACTVRIDRQVLNTLS